MRSRNYEASHFPVVVPPPSTHPKFCRFISLCDNVAWQVSSATKAEYVVVRPSSYLHHFVSTSSSMYNKYFSNVVCERVRLPTSVCNQPLGRWVPFSACEKILCTSLPLRSCIGKSGSCLRRGCRAKACSVVSSDPSMTQRSVFLFQLVNLCPLLNHCPFCVRPMPVCE